MVSNKEKPIRGTREWAVAAIDCCAGCPHGCRYCYARYDLVDRKKSISGAEWNGCRILKREVEREHPLYDGQVMFPANHDITPENLAACLKVIHNLIDAGNQVLLVSKPQLSCIEKICLEFTEKKEQLLFRFTITAREREILSCWEPGAPEYEERKTCLKHAYDRGYATSVSVEPMLDTDDVITMVHELMPHVSHSIWLGKMNKIGERVRCDSAGMKAEIDRLKFGQNDSRISYIYEELKGIKKIRWKESIKSVIGLEMADKPGLDV